MRLGALGFALLAAVTVAACTTQGSAPSQAGGGEASGGTARIRLVKRESFCQERPAEARLYVFLTLRNVGDADGKVSALPVRRYTDGSTNDSVLDLITDMKVPAGSARRYRASFDYNALKHDLLECSVKLDKGDGLGDPVPLRVAAPG